MSGSRIHTALTIAGSDSSGGAGIQADIKTFTTLRVYGMTVITAITAQNTLGVQSAMLLPLEIVRQQFQSVCDDIPVDAVKTGMLPTIEMIELIGSLLSGLDCPYICDPVMVAKSGDRLIDQDAIGTVRKVLLPLAYVITPNRHEAQALLRSDSPINTLDQAKLAAGHLFDCGAKNIIIKAIALGDDKIGDLLYDGESFVLFESTRKPEGRSHGSGCTFNAAITAELAKGKLLNAAIATARKLIDHALDHALQSCQGVRPVNVLGFNS